MKFTRQAILVLALCGVPIAAQAGGAGIEWEILNEEVMDLYRAGNYARALKVAQEALQVAVQNAGPDHPDVATVLENLAELYKTQKQDDKAASLWQRAQKIRALSR